MVEFPVEAKFIEQTVREDGVAVLGPFGLFDADHHTIAIDVRDFEVSDLANSQTGGIGGHQKDAVSRRVSASEEPFDLLTAEKFWESGRFLASGNGEVDPVPAQDFEIEEAESRYGDIATAPGEAALDGKVKQVSVDFVNVELVRRKVVKLNQRADSTQIGLLSPERETAQVHGIDHFVAKSTHRTS